MELIRGSERFSSVIVYLAREQFLIFQVFIDFVWSDKRCSRPVNLSLCGTPVQGSIQAVEIVIRKFGRVV